MGSPFVIVAPYGGPFSPGRSTKSCTADLNQVQALRSKGEPDRRSAGPKEFRLLKHERHEGNEMNHDEHDRVVPVVTVVVKDA
jgi:hypothetical protein